MKTEQQKALDKIKKCLKLAACSATQGNEAANALKQAQALMAKYRLTMTDVQASEVNKARQKATVKTKPAKWETGLACAVADAFGCKLIFSEGFYSSQRGNWNFIGVEAMPELAAYAFDVLLRQLKRDRSAYVKNELKRCKPATQRARAVKYCEGWVASIYTKLAAMAPSVTAATAIAAYMEKNYSHVTDLDNRANPKGKGRSYNDEQSGWKAGKQANLNRPVRDRGEQAGLEAQL